MRRAVFVSLLIGACVRQTHDDKHPAVVNGAGSPDETPVRAASEKEVDAAEGLVVRLKDAASAPGEDAARAPVAEVKVLEPAAVARLLARLPPLEVKAGDVVETALRPSSRPPPKTGETVEVPFPPPEAAAGALPQATEAPLEIARVRPEGPVPIAADLSVTFSEAMVAVGAHADAARERPVRLEPEPPGRWRWVGTRTLLFSPEVRFPMATTYRVSVPQGVRAASGKALAAEKAWTFTTPPPSVVTFWPQHAHARLDTAIFVAFDQKIDPDAVLETIALKAGGKGFELRRIAPEAAPDPEVARMAAAAEPGRWIVLRPAAALPAATEVRVAIGPKTPSAEGPRVTEKAQEYRFTTHGEMQVEAHRCGWNERCPPYTPFWIEFTNPIDADTFDAALVRASPEIPGMHTYVNGVYLQIHGATRGRTKYTITVSGELRDAYGQKLGEDATVAVEVGSADASLSAQGEQLVILDPYAPEPSFSVYSVNYPRLHLRVYAVEPAQFATFVGMPDEKAPLPGRKVHDGMLEIEGEKDQLVETRIDLAPHLRDGVGQIVIDVVPPDEYLTTDQRRWPPRVLRWLQATKIGLDAHVDSEQLLAWATELATGATMPGVELAIEPHGLRARSDAQGVATFELPGKAPAAPGVLIARKGDDVAFVPEVMWRHHGKSGWAKGTSRDEVRFFIFDDRGMYRPGERAHVKGYLRRIGAGTKGDVGGVDGLVETLAWVLSDVQGNELAKGTTKPNSFGAFALELALPKTMNLGEAHLALTAHGSKQQWGWTHYLRVEEFRRPEFEVSARAGEGPHLVGETAIASVRAAYYAGGGLAGAEVTWAVTTAPGSYVPPNRDDFSFGVWIPWWSGGGFGRTIHVGGQSQPAGRHRGLTDAAGEHHLALELAGVRPPRATNVSAQATVMDVNRQAWSATASLLVHPAAEYVGLRSKKPFVAAGQPIELEAIAVDLDGNAVTGRTIDMGIARMVWERRKGRWEEVPADEQRCALTSAKEAVPCRVEPKAGGRHRALARVTDARGRINETQIDVWVAGGEVPPSRGVEQQQVELIPDRKEYRAGDTAEVLVRAPFVPARGLLTVRRSGIVTRQAIELAEASQIARVRIEEGWLPGVTVQVDLDGTAPRVNDDGALVEGLPPRPAFATGSVFLAIPPVTRALAVEARPKATQLEPGAETELDVAVTGPDGRPIAGAEVAVVVADESVLALSNHTIADPLGVFYTVRPPDTRDYRSRANVLLARPAELLAQGEAPPPPPPPPEGSYMLASPAPGGAVKRRTMVLSEVSMLEAGNGGGEHAPIAVRADFSPLALFAPSLITGEDGRTSVKLKLPDNLTRYRVTAVAVSGGKLFGRGESSITARKALMVRPSLPRFLNFGDAAELPVVVQNQTDQPLQVEVAARVTNAELTAGQGRSFAVPPQDRVEVRFPARSAKPGTARMQIAAASGPHSDAAELSLPVWTPATTEAFATYGEVDAGAVFQPVAMPSDVITTFGGLEIDLSSTQLQALTDAVVSLVSYPFDCSEQIASRVIAIAALKDVLNAFEAEGLPPPKVLLAAVDRDLERLRGMQNEEGGFPFWRKWQPSWPFNTIHAAHAMARAKEKRFPVNAQMLAGVHDYLRAIERRFPSEYSPELRRVLTAYALYVRQLLDDRDGAAARRLIADAGGVEKLPLEAIGWLYPVLAGDAASANELAAIRKLLDNRATETAGTAHFATSYGDGAHLILHSDRRADGLILYGLIADRPDSDLIPKIVRGLLANRTKGHWSSTQENVWVLLALDRYFATYEKTPPSFTARVWLGRAFAGEHRFRGRTTDTAKIEIPMSFLAKLTAPERLALVKDGTGRLYYRIGMRYAPESLQLAPEDHGFTVERMYEPIDDPADVRREPDGSWRMRAGAKVRVRVTMVAAARRYHVALVDPLPAGLEPINPALAVSESVPLDPSAAIRWWGVWYEHQNLRDERAEVFTSLLWEGVHEYVYVARATTPGAFVVPPAKAEEMYAPETFGRTATDRVVVE